MPNASKSNILSRRRTKHCLALRIDAHSFNVPAIKRRKDDLAQHPFEKQKVPKAGEDRVGVADHTQTTVSKATEVRFLILPQVNFERNLNQTFSMFS